MRDYYELPVYSEKNARKCKLEITTLSAQRTKESTTGKEIVGGVAAGKKEANREVMGADGFISAFDLLRHF